MTYQVDVKVVKFLGKLCNFYLKKRKIESDSDHFSRPSYISSYFLPYLNVSNSINVIDIGAHKGAFIDELQKYYLINQALLIEPIPELVSTLKIKFNDSKFSIYQNAITNKQSYNIDFMLNESSPTSSLLNINNEFKELSQSLAKLNKIIKIDTNTLDAITEDSKIGFVDLIKIDVQGTESLVIEGAYETLKRTNFLWIEVSFKPLYEGSSTFNDVYMKLNSLGFVMLEIVPGYRYGTNELLQADALFTNTNFSKN